LNKGKSAYVDARRASKGGVLTILLGAVAQNFKTFQSLSPRAEVFATVKANAYGCGATHVGPALARVGCRGFFVAIADEGISLRQALDDNGFDAEIFVFNGVTPASAPAFLAANLIPVINTQSQLEAWIEAAKTGERTLPAALHADTGMNRLGLSPDDLQAIKSGGLDCVTVKMIMSHLACADEPSNPINLAQLNAFSDCCALFPNARASLCNSAGALLGKQFHFDVLRPGIGLYGGRPMNDAPVNFKPTIKLEAPILQVREISSGEGVGYRASFRANNPSRIATVGVGYADGYRRSLGNRSEVSINGHRAPVVGRISMDLLTIDVTNVPQELVQPTRLVELIGPNVTIDELADLAETIPYEILTGLGDRFERRYIE
jgi:alanine racemase